MDELMQRGADRPIHKETVCSELFGRFIAIAEMAGLKKGKEYETAVKPILECSTKILWLDQVSEKLQATVVIKSVDCSVEYGVVEKATKNVLHRAKLEGLRYKISAGTSIEWTEGSRAKIDALITEFNEWFGKIKAA